MVWILVVLTGLSLLNTVALAILGWKLTQSLLPQKHRPPSEELHEFLKDLHVHGYGILRVDPDTILKRSPRG